MTQSCIVIGAGMVGAACAYRLQAAGCAVTLIDPGMAEAGASFGNAGHIAVEQVEPLSSWSTLRSAPRMLYGLGGPLDFRLSDAGAWVPWATRFIAASSRRRFEAGTQALSSLMDRALGAWTTLLGDVGKPDLIRTDGHVVLWFSEKEAVEGARSWAAANTGPARAIALSGGDLARYRALMPARPPMGGLKFEGTGRLASPAVVRRSLVDAFKEAGGQVVVGQVDRIGPNTSVHLGGGRALTADQVVITAGVRSRGLMAQLGVRAPLIAERGYSIQFDAPAWPTDLPTAVNEGQSIVLAPHAEGLRVTSYVEFARPDSRPDPRKWDRLERRVRELGLPVSSSARRWMGCRPTLPDYLPAIGRLDERVLYAFGHQHLGITLSAITADLIAAASSGAPVDPRFDIRRFSD